MEDAASALKRFQAGGAVRESSLYVERRADRELFEALLRGEPCHVLATTQTGKSSLKIRTARRLEAEGVQCALIELSGGVSEEQWYYGLARSIAREAGIDVDLDAFWDREARLGFVQRWIAFLREELLPRTRGCLVVFLDEINAVLGLDFPSEPFFAALREVHDARAADGRLQEITFCVLGIAFPEALMKDPARSPFRSSRGIVLDDFAREEIEPFGAGLAASEAPAEEILDEVFAWTHGHPYMTQRLCEVLAGQQGEGGAEERVRRAVQQERLLQRLGDGRCRDSLRVPPPQSIEALARLDARLVGRLEFQASPREHLAQICARLEQPALVEEPLLHLGVCLEQGIQDPLLPGLDHGIVGRSELPHQLFARGHRHGNRR